MSLYRFATSGDVLRVKYCYAPRVPSTIVWCVLQNLVACVATMIAMQSTYYKSGCLSLLLFVIFFSCILSKDGLEEILQFNRFLPQKKNRKQKTHIHCIVDLEWSCFFSTQNYNITFLDCMILLLKWENSQNRDFDSLISLLTRFVFTTSVCN